jgi:hypothetical protein
VDVDDRIKPVWVFVVKVEELEGFELDPVVVDIELDSLVENIDVLDKRLDVGKVEIVVSIGELNFVDSEVKSRVDEV